MDSAGVAPNHATFTALLASCKREGDVALAKHALGASAVAETPPPLHLADGQPLLLLPDGGSRGAGSEGETRFGVVTAAGDRVALPLAGGDVSSRCVTRRSDLAGQLGAAL